jgi:hypothetical protein
VGVALGLGFALWSFPAAARGQDVPFVRGNANGDLGIDIGDAVFILAYNFQGARRPPCMDAADTNDDGGVDISDAIYLLNFLFTGGTRQPPAPYPDPGTDPTADPLGCVSAMGEPIVLRHGTLFELQHEVAGDVKILSNRVVRIQHFYYDGQGTPEVVVVLHRSLGTESRGTIISPDLLGHRYDDVTLEYPIPPQVADGDFQYVSIWCTDFPLNYGYARLFNN